MGFFILKDDRIILTTVLFPEPLKQRHRFPKGAIVQYNEGVMTPATPLTVPGQRYITLHDSDHNHICPIKSMDENVRLGLIVNGNHFTSAARYPLNRQGNGLEPDKNNTSGAFSVSNVTELGHNRYFLEGRIITS